MSFETTSARRTTLNYDALSDSVWEDIRLAAVASGDPLDVALYHCARARKELPAGFRVTADGRLAKLEALSAGAWDELERAGCGRGAPKARYDDPLVAAQCWRDRYTRSQPTRDAFVREVLPELFDYTLEELHALLTPAQRVHVLASPWLDARHMACWNLIREHEGLNEGA